MRLELAKVSVARGSRTILRHIDLTVAAGEVVSILGPSGAGKSTLFASIAGELSIASGLMRLDGNDVACLPLWRRARLGVGYLPQTPNVLGDLTVRRNLEVFEDLVPHPKRGATAWAQEADLVDRLDLAARLLSGGERRRLEVARALVLRPRLLLCDEPFAGVDPSGSSRLGDWLRTQAEEGAAVLLSDHHVGQALRISHRAILMLDGELVAQGPASSFATHPLVQSHYLGFLT